VTAGGSTSEFGEDTRTVTATDGAVTDTSSNTLRGGVLGGSGN
jgi:hypothetical protein